MNKQIEKFLKEFLIVIKSFFEDFINLFNRK